MSGLIPEGPIGVLQPGWSAEVGDYAIAGGWILHGEALVVGDAAGGIYAFDGNSGETIWVQQGVHAGGVLAMAINPIGTIFASAGQDGRVLIWSAKEGQITQNIDIGKGWVENLAWSPDGKWLAATFSRQVRVFAADGAEVWQSDNHPGAINAIVWSSSGELATACYGQVSFFNATNGEMLQKLESKGSLVSMVLSQDGNIVACGSQDNSVHFWDRATEQHSKAECPGKPSRIDFDETGTLLSASGGKVVTVFRYRQSDSQAAQSGVLDHDQSVTALAFPHHSMRLASGDRKGAVVIWSLQSDGSGGPAGAGFVTDAIAELHWRPDDCALAALDAHGGVTVWRLDSEHTFH